MDTSALEESGLSNAEARIYVALLERGPSKTGVIIDATKLQSSTVYHVLGSLVEKGIVTYIFKGKMKYYQAESPDSLIAFIDEKKRKLKEILPQLKEKERLSTQRQTAKVYEGIKGLQTAYNDVLETMHKGEEYYFFQFPKSKLENNQIVTFFRNYHLKRSEKGIRVKGLASKETRSIMKEAYNLPFTRIRYVSEVLPTVMVVYRDKLLMIEWEERPTAIVIHSKEIAQSYKRFFEEKWKKASL